MEQTLTSHVEHRSQSLKNLFKRLFNGDDSPVANRRGTQGLDVANLKIQLQSEYIVVSSGPVRFVCVCVNREHRLIKIYFL